VEDDENSLVITGTDFEFADDFTASVTLMGVTADSVTIDSNT
jgi:hypothetical protein